MATSDRLIAIKQRGFSPAFDRLVQNQEDLVGLLAYGIHKERKRALAIKRGLARDDLKLRQYGADLTAKDVVELRRTAKQSLKVFATTIQKETIRQLQDNQLDRIGEML